MDADGWGRLVAKMAMGYRPVIDRDAEQLARDCSPRLKPKLATLPNGEVVVKVDETTQLKALTLVAEIHGWKKSGLNVNVNTAAGGVAGNHARVASLGELMVLIESQGHGALQRAVAALPAEERRRIATALLEDARQVKIPVAVAQENGDGGTETERGWQRDDDSAERGRG